MALPADAINKYRIQYSAGLLDDVENACRLHRPDIYQTYFGTMQYGHSPETGNTVALRQLRVLGCLMGVSWATSNAATEAAIVTAVQALVA